MQTTQPTFKIEGSYTDSSGQTQTTSAKVKAQSINDARRKAQQALSRKYSGFKVSDVQKIAEQDEQMKRYTIVHGTNDPVHREERLYTIVENVTSADQARQLAQTNLPKSEQDRYIIKTTEGKYVPNGVRPNYINPLKEQKEQQKQKQLLTESTNKAVQQTNDNGQDWRAAKLYEDMDKSRFFKLAGINESEQFKEGDKVKVKQDVTNPQAKKYAGKQGTVDHIDGNFINVSVKGARSATMEFLKSELEKTN